MKAPTLLSILTAAAGSHSSRTQQPDTNVILMAAAILLKQRNKHMCLLQTVIGCVLYSGHASKRVRFFISAYMDASTGKAENCILMQVYTRLSRLGICIAHQTVARVIKSLGVNFDKKVQEWKMVCNNNHSTSYPPSDAVDFPQYVIVGDNIDKNVSPRHMTLDSQTKSYHYFHSYAVHDRVDLSSCSNEVPDIDVESLPLTAFLPSFEDCKKLRENYITLASRVLVNHLDFLKPLQHCVPKHIKHRYTAELKRKSVVVGNIPCSLVVDLDLITRGI